MKEEDEGDFFFFSCVGEGRERERYPTSFMIAVYLPP